MHIGAIICFALALFFYSFAWGGVAAGLAIFGIFFEIAAWVIWFSTNDGTKT
jgi:asparagine N-glycosylation enzyme membrane subunit Stt3